MNVELINYPKEEDWLEVKRRCLVTIGLKEVKNPPTTEWKHALLKSRHSPIRRLMFSFFLENIPYWLSTELSRHHIGYEKYIKSQRNDRQEDYDRNKAPQDAPVNMIIDLNAESLITLCEKRLCGVATKEAQQVVNEMKKIVTEKYPEFDGLLDTVCKKYGYCNEMKSCGRLAAYSKAAK